MKASIFLGALALLAPASVLAQRQEIRELQRDVALVQDQLRTLQRSIDERMAALTVLVQQALDNINKINTTVAVLDSSVRDRLREQEKALVGPVAGIGAKVDQMSSEFASVRESVSDLNSRLTKVQQQLVDIGNAVKTLQAPPPPPGSPAASGGPPGMSPTSLFQSALNDKLGGNYDLALKEFTDYLTSFGNTEAAPIAQFHIGEIHYNRGQLESAQKAFDLVLERYPENERTPDALYMKGMTLVKMGQRTAGAREFQELIGRFPRSEQAKKAAAQLRAMGLSAAPRRPSPTKKR